MPTLTGIAFDEVQVRKVIIEVRYWTARAFFDKRAELIAVSETGDDRLTRDENNIRMEDQETGCTRTVNMFRAGIANETLDHRARPGGFMLDDAFPWIKSVWETLERPPLRRIGVRQLAIYPYMGADYGSLSQQVIGALCASQPRSWDPLGFSPQDLNVRFKLACSDDSVSGEYANLFLGPFQEPELRDKLQNRSGIPAMGLWADWDYYCTSDAQARDLKDVNDMLRRAKDQMCGQVAEFLRTL